MEQELDIDFYDHRAEFMPPRPPQPARNVLDTSLEQGVRGAHTNFAIDAPDGEPDGHWEEELEDMKHWLAGQDRPIDDVKADELLRLAVDGPYAFAVDAPDGEVDAHVTEEYRDMKHWLQGQDTPVDDVKAEELLRLAEPPLAYAVDAPDGEPDAHWVEDLDDARHMLDKEILEEYVWPVKELMQCAKTNYAVDAPDGSSDGQLEEEVLLAGELMDHIREPTHRIVDDELFTGDIDDWDHRAVRP